MKSEFKIFRPCTVVENRVDKGHDGRLEENKDESK